MSTTATASAVVRATYASFPSGETAMPRGSKPSCNEPAGLSPLSARSKANSSPEKVAVASKWRPSGVMRHVVGRFPQGTSATTVPLATSTSESRIGNLVGSDESGFVRRQNQIDGRRLRRGIQSLLTGLRFRSECQ